MRIVVGGNLYNQYEDLPALIVQTKLPEIGPRLLKLVNQPILSVLGQ